MGRGTLRTLRTLGTLRTPRTLGTLRTPPTPPAYIELPTRESFPPCTLQSMRRAAAPATIRTVRSDMSNASASERAQVVVIGGGQAGLSLGYCLARQGLSFVILEASPRVGDSWRRRWDSLRLFTPAKYDGLIGMPFPAPPQSFPTKDEMAAYLEAYAADF